jgi:hypothetical protein
MVGAYVERRGGSVGTEALRERSEDLPLMRLCHESAGFSVGVYLPELVALTSVGPPIRPLISALVDSGADRTTSPDVNRARGRPSRAALPVPVARTYGRAGNRDVSHRIDDRALDLCRQARRSEWLMRDPEQQHTDQQHHYQAEAHDAEERVSTDVAIPEVPNRPSDRVSKRVPTLEVPGSPFDRLHPLSLFVSWGSCQRRADPSLPADDVDTYVISTRSEGQPSIQQVACLDQVRRGDPTSPLRSTPTAAGICGRSQT